jgi:hypothetical protein
MKVRVPADTDLPDTLVAGLTAHQLLLAAPGVATVLVGGLLLTLGIVPVWTALVGLVVVAVSIGVVLTNPDGMTYDRFVIARLRHRRASRLEVMVQPPSDLPVWVAAAQQPEKAVGLDLPWGGLDHEVPALVPLGRDESGSELGEALVLALSPLDVRSMDEGEVAKVVVALESWLNSLDCEAQVLVSARPCDNGNRSFDFESGQAHPGALPPGEDVGAGSLLHKSSG